MRPAQQPRVEDRFTGVRRVCDALRAAGIRHALGGGALRWSLGLAGSVRDWDLTTDAREEEVRAALADFGVQREGVELPYASAFCYQLHMDGEVVDLIGDFTIASAADRGALPAPARPDESPTLDLTAGPAGERTACTENWSTCAAAWRSVISDALYGPMPPEPDRLEFSLAAQARVTRLPGSPSLSTYRLRAFLGGLAIPLTLQLLRPDRPDPVPVVLEGDAGWWAPSDALVGELLARGVALARLDRTEVAYDIPTARPRGPLPDALGTGDTGAIAHWAWALRRGLDLLEQLSGIDPQRMALSGFSRGGKASLLAGAWDARARLVHAHASGAGGAASARCTPPGAERLLDVVSRFPSWFAPGALALAAAPHALPFDQHALVAAIAPRQVVLTCGLGDRWANPHGTARSVAAAAPAFALSGQPALLWRVRPGGHTLEGADWRLVAQALQASAIAPRNS